MEYGKKTEKFGKRETHSIGSEIYRETLKTWKMRNKQCNT
jgi:hypothetical protein